MDQHKNAVVSVSCAKMCLDTERRDCTTSIHVKQLFQTAASDGKLEELKWVEKIGYELDTMLGKDTNADAALYGHLKEVKYLRKLSVLWDNQICANAAEGGHLELLKWARVN